MPSKGDFSVSVLVGGSALAEFRPTNITQATYPCDAYVESNFNVPGVSYPVEVEEQDPFVSLFLSGFPRPIPRTTQYACI